MTDMVLLGRFDVRVDKGGYVCIPSEWRKEMGDPPQIYLMGDVNEQCLDLIPKGQFEEYVLSDVDDPDESTIRDRVKRDARLISIDSKGRVRLDRDLRRETDIGDVVAMVGCARYIKLCNSDVALRENDLSAKAWNHALEELNP